MCARLSLGLLLLAAGCQNTSPPPDRATGRHRQALEDQPGFENDPLVEIAEAEVGVGTDTLFIVPMGSLNAAIEESTNRPAPKEDDISFAASVAEVGNTQAALGITADNFVHCPQGCLISGNVFIAADQDFTRIYEEGSEVHLQTTKYDLVTTQLSNKLVGWMARAQRVLLKPSIATVSDSRCCGESRECVAVDPVVAGGGCGPTDRVRCGADIESRLLPQGTDVSNGRPEGEEISVKVWPAGNAASSGIPIDLTCLAPLGPQVGQGTGLGLTECGIATFDCDPPTLWSTPAQLGRFWTATLDQTNHCLPGSSRPVSGVDLPERCHAVSSPMAVLPECRGHCVDCKPWEQEPDSFMEDYVPPHCAVAQYDPENSSICLRGQDKIDHIQAQTTWMLSMIDGNDCHSPSITGNCCGDGCTCEATLLNGWRLCQQCDSEGCTQKYLPPAHDPLAKTGSPTKCGNTTCDNDPPSGGGTIPAIGGAPPEKPAAENPGPPQPPPTPPSEPKVAGKGSPDGEQPGGPTPPKPDPGPQHGAAGHQPAAGGSGIKEHKSEQGDPIGLLAGDLTISQTDLNYPGPVSPLTFTRSYSSQSVHRGALGSNWRHNWEIHLEFLREGTNPLWAPLYCAGGTEKDPRCLMLHGPSGDATLFLYDELTGVFMPQAGSTHTVIRIDNNPFATGIPNIFTTGWALRTAHGALMIFDVDGYLIDTRDRFGNGFKVTQEDTPLFTLWKDCKAHAAGTGGIVPRGCRLVDAMIGEKALSQERLNPAEGTLQLSLAVHPEAEAWFNANFANNGPVLGRNTFGALRKRPTRVEDDLGRALIFRYATPSTPGYSHTAAKAHLLVEVEGPAGGLVQLAYGRNPLEPADMNESYLVQVDRADITSSAIDVSPTPLRSVVLAYDWAPVDHIEVGGGTFGVQGTVFDRFREYFATFVGCNASYRDLCSNIITPWFAPGNPGEYARTAALNLASATWDNLLTVRVAGILEAGTRYVRNPLSANYDRAIEQRYGSRQSVAPLPGPALPHSQLSWTPDEAALPLAVFEYVEAGPSADPFAAPFPADRTEAPLPQALRQKYGLENVTLANAVLNIIPANTGSVGTTGPRCNFIATETARMSLPGHVPSYGYFQAPGFNGQFNPDMELRRTHLTCEQLAEAHRSDSFSNDNISILNPAYEGIGSGTTLPGGGYRDISRHYAERIDGRRSRVATDANRICQWTKFVDRDGNQTWHGLNFQGQSLVEAVTSRFDANSVRITERRFNADGHVVREFRPFILPAAPLGVVQYEYEEIQPNGNNGANEQLPLWWTHRGNVIRRSDKIFGTATVESESSPGAFSSITESYEKYEYEPIYNQIRYVERGTTSAGTTPVSSWHSKYELTHDYQELTLNSSSANSIRPLLDSLRGWGIYWSTTSSGNYDYTKIASDQLRLAFHGADLNEDGMVGFPLENNVSNHRGRGVPVHGEEHVPGAGQLARRQKFQWSGAGQLARYWDTLGVDERRSYYPLKDSSGNPVLGGSTAPVAPNVKVVEQGFLARIRRRLGPAGYAMDVATASYLNCGNLEGPYQFLLPFPCTANVVADLKSIGYSEELAAAIVSASREGENAFDDTQVSYNIAGHPRYVWSNRQRAHQVTDVDGRPLSGEAADGVSVQYQYDAARRLTAVSRSLSTQVASQVAFRRDDEGRVLAQCVAREPGACATFPAVPRPLNASVVERSYTYEGHPKSTTDVAGVMRTPTVDERGLVWNVTTTAPSAPTFEGRRTAWTYDLDGLVLSESRGQTVGGTDSLLTRTWARNAFGEVWSFNDGHTSWAIDRSARGLVTHVRETSSGSNLWSVRFGYDAWGEGTTRTLNGQLVHETLRSLWGLDIGERGWGLAAVYYAKDFHGNVLWRSTGQEHDVSVYDVANSRLFTASRPSSTAQPLMTRISLDPMGRPLEWEERGGELSRTRSVGRNVGGFVENEIGFDGFSATFTRNLLGWPTHVERQAGTEGQTTDSVDYVYNELGQPTTVTDPKGEVTTYQYSPIGELKSLVGQGSHAPNRTWGYDRLSRLDYSNRSTGIPYSNLDYIWTGLRLDRIDADGSPVVAFERDTLGRPQFTTAYNRGVFHGVPREVRLDLTYDSLGNVEREIQTVDGETRTVESTWSLNGSGRRQRTLRVPHLPNGTTNWQETFNANGLLSSKVRTLNGPATSATFNYLGSIPIGRTEFLGHGGSPLRHTVTLDELYQPRETSWTVVDLNAQGNPFNTVEGDAYCLGHWTPDCARPAYSEDLVRYSSGQLASVLSRYGFPSQVGTERHRWLAPFYGGRGEIVGTYDEWGQSTPPDTQSVTNHYVQAGDVVGLGDNNSLQAWTYEREEATGALLNVIHTQHEPRLRLSERQVGYRMSSATIAQQEKELTYDDDGPVTKFGDSDLEWGPLGELAAVRRSSTTEVYLYDAFGRLSARADNDKILETYLWDGVQMVASIGGPKPGTSRWEATWGAGLDELVEFRTFDSAGTTSTEYVPFTDYRHSLTGLMEYTTRRTSEIMTYTPEGAVTIRDDHDNIVCDQSAGADPCALPHGAPFGFNSAWTSSFSGLTYMRNRWYAAELGEFLSQDPLGPVDSFSLYAFAGFDPINKRDPFGLCASGAGVDTVACIAASSSSMSATIATTSLATSSTGAAGLAGVASSTVGAGTAVTTGTGILATLAAVAPPIAALIVALTPSTVASGCGGGEACATYGPPAAPAAPATQPQASYSPPASFSPPASYPWSPPTAPAHSAANWPKVPRPELDVNEKVHGELDEIEKELPKNPNDLSDLLEELDRSIPVRREELGDLGEQLGELTRRPPDQRNPAQEGALRRQIRNHERRVNREEVLRKRIDDELKKKKACSGSKCGFAG